MAPSSSTWFIIISTLRNKHESPQQWVHGTKGTCLHLEPTHSRILNKCTCAHTWMEQKKTKNKNRSLLSICSYLDDFWEINTCKEENRYDYHSRHNKPLFSHYAILFHPVTTPHLHMKRLDSTFQH